MDTAIKLFLHKRVVSAIYTLMLLVMIAWLMFGLATLAWSLLDEVQANSVVSNATASRQLPSRAPAKQNIRLVTELNLFGKIKQVGQVGQQSKLANIKAPETRLKLKLMGLRKGTGSIRSSAIVEGPDKKQAIYYIGDTLPSGGAVVEEIFIQHMIISRKGKYETLTLFTVLSTKQVSDKNIQGAVSNLNLTDLTSNQFVTKKLNKYKGIALKEPSALNGIVNVQAVVEGKKFKGYRLSPGIDSALFRRAGLVRGDLLTSINGVKLDSPNKVLSLLGSLALASDLELTIDRNGEPMSFRYTF